VFREQALQVGRRMFTGVCVRLWRPDDPFQLFITIATACFVRTAWDGTEMGSSEYFAISTAEKVKAVCTLWDRRITGAASHSTNSGAWNCWMERGEALLTIRARPPA
jgi:hypothetical protein